MKKEVHRIPLVPDENRLAARGIFLCRILCELFLNNPISC